MYSILKIRALDSSPATDYYNLALFDQAVILKVEMRITD